MKKVIIIALVGIAAISLLKGVSKRAAVKDWFIRNQSASEAGDEEIFDRLTDHEIDTVYAMFVSPGYTYAAAPAALMADLKSISIKYNIFT